jgi:hypothetical protein
MLRCGSRRAVITTADSGPLDEKARLPEGFPRERRCGRARSAGPTFRRQTSN